MTLRALDLYCGAGGAARGLQMAGFEVTGVDNVRQPNYCGDWFFHWDALLYLHSFLGAGAPRKPDLIWASPPCQAHTSLRKMHNAKDHVDLIPETRRLLKEIGAPYVIENVVGAPLEKPIRLCGTMFGLKSFAGAELRRHRLFEANFPIRQPKCRHGDRGVIGVYGGHYRNRSRKSGLNREAPDFSREDGFRAMGVDWDMTGEELSQAIPPAFACYVGREFINWRFAQGERIAA